MGKCRVCNVELTDENWAPSLRNKNSRICKKCHYEKGMIWRRGNRDRVNKSSRKHYRKDPSKHHKAVDKARKKVRIDMIAAYGGKCARCGISDVDVLAIDHIYNNGAEDRRNHLYGYNLYRQLKKLGWPKDEFQLLCKNCNWKKHLENIRKSHTKYLKQ